MPKVRQEMFDADYIHRLSPEDREFYGKFISEYYGASIEKINVKVKRKGKKTLKFKKVKPGHLHSTNALAKECMDANNRRNNDLFGVTRANGLASSIFDESDEWYKDRNLGLSESAMIAKLSHIHEDENTQVLCIETGETFISVGLAAQRLKLKLSEIELNIEKGTPTKKKLNFRKIKA